MSSVENVYKRLVEAPPSPLLLENRAGNQQEEPPPQPEQRCVSFTEAPVNQKLPRGKSLTNLCTMQQEGEEEEGNVYVFEQTQPINCGASNCNPAIYLYPSSPQFATSTGNGNSSSSNSSNNRSYSSQLQTQGRQVTEKEELVPQHSSTANPYQLSLSCAYQNTEEAGTGKILQRETSQEYIAKKQNEQPQKIEKRRTQSQINLEGLMAAGKGKIESIVENLLPHRSSALEHTNDVAESNERSQIVGKTFLTSRGSVSNNNNTTTTNAPLQQSEEIFDAMPKTTSLNNSHLNVSTEDERNSAQSCQQQERYIKNLQTQQQEQKQNYALQEVQNIVNQEQQQESMSHTEPENDGKLETLHEDPVCESQLTRPGESLRDVMQEEPLQNNSNVQALNSYETEQVPDQDVEICVQDRFVSQSESKTTADEQLLLFREVSYLFV